MVERVSTFAMPSEYERAAMEARRRRRMAEMLAQQAYVPQDVGVAPIPSAAPLVQGLQAFLTARQQRKAEEAAEKAEKADVAQMRELLTSLGPQERSGAEAAVQDIVQNAQMGQLGRDGTYTPSTITPSDKPIGMPYTEAAPTGQARQDMLLAAMAGGSPRAAKLAEVLMGQKPEVEEFGTTPVLSESGEYVVFGKGGTARPTGVRGAPKDQDLTPYQREMLRLRERELGIRERGMGPERQRPLSPTAQKELFETDENVLATQTGIDLLQNARLLSPKAFEGPLAAQRATAATVLPDEIEPAGAKETLEFDLLIKQQVLPQLRSIFGAAPTEGERAILLELQGSSSLPKKVRDSLLNRAIQAAQRRLQFNRQKSEQLRSGSYFREAPMELGGGLPSGFELDQ